MHGSSFLYLFEALFVRTTMSRESSKGIDYVLKSSMTKEIESISSVRSLQNQTICLDNRSNTDNALLLKEKRSQTKKNRKYKFQSYSIRKFRKQNEKLKKGSLRYASLDKISELWGEYSKRIGESELSVAKMDLHGAFLTVTKANDPSYVGVKGRVVKESYGSIILITEDDKLKHIIKNHTVAELQLPHGKFEINFSALRCRPYLKMTKKWKSRTPLEIPY